MSGKPPPPPLRSAKRLTTPPGAAERREHIRYALVAQVQLRRGGDVAVLDVQNISAGGLLVALSEGEDPGAEAGDRVSVFVDIGDDVDGTPISVDADAEVIRINRGGAGRTAGIALRWLSSDPDFTSRLSRFLERINEVAVDAEP